MLFSILIETKGQAAPNRQDIAVSVNHYRQAPGRVGEFVCDDSEFCRRALEDESIQGLWEALDVVPTVCWWPDEREPRPSEESQQEQSTQDRLP